MSRADRPRLAAAQAHWRLLDADLDDLLRLAYQAAVDAGARGAEQSGLKKLYDFLLVDVAPLREAMKRAVFRWAYGHSRWLPALWPSAVYDRLARFQGDLRALLPAVPPHCNTESTP